MSKKIDFKMKSDKAAADTQLYALLERRKKTSVSLPELQKLVGLTNPSNTQLKNFLASIERLTGQNKLVLHKGRIAIPKRLSLQTATIVKVNATFGFARVEGQETDVFIPGKLLCGAMPGDTVLIRQNPSTTEQLPDGEVVKITTEINQQFSGTLRLENDSCFVLPDQYVRFPLSATCSKTLGAKNGDKVLVEVTHRGKRHSEHKVNVVQLFGTSELATNCCAAILASGGIEQAFSPEALEQARAISCGVGIHPKELEVRLDLRDTLTLTMDGAESKDLDDAISLIPVGDGWELSVHIADVSYYVTHKTPLGVEAYARGTSIYYANKVIPMLPEELSNGICSLNAGEDHLAFSAILTLDNSYKLVGYRFVKTVINSNLKGIYSEANDIINGTQSAEITEKYGQLTPMILDMKTVASGLRKRRFARGAVNLNSVESIITVDENDKAVDVSARKSGFAEGIIEEFMLLTNEAAATFAIEKGVPFIYRIHEKPSPDRLENLYQVLEKLNVPFTRPEGTITGVNLSQILRQVQGSKLDPVVNTMVLRAMAKARYSPNNLGHFGLALDNYAQFTAPIRRFPDLALHRILSAVVTGMKNENIEKHFSSFVAQSSAQSTAREIVGMAVSRNCEDCYKAEYMASFVGQAFDAVVTSSLVFGMYVQLKNTVEGRVSLANFPDGDWEFDGSIGFDQHTTGGRIQVGDSVQVMLDSVDVSAGQVNFSVIKCV